MTPARAALEAAFAEGRNVLPGATDDQSAVIEAWAKRAIDADEQQPRRALVTPMRRRRRDLPRAGFGQAPWPNE